MEKRIVKTPTEARASTKEGVGRYVLLVSMALCVVLAIIGYIIYIVR